MNNRDRKNKSSLSAGKIIGLLIALLALPSELIGIIIVFGLIGFVCYLVFKTVKAQSHSPQRRPDNFDECPKPFCFHRDKGEHHVRRGKEIDPWDRPDIDISKYQRR